MNQSTELLQRDSTKAQSGAHSANLFACSECDLLIDLPSELKHSDDLYCPRCKHLITHGERFDDHYLAALMVTALIAFFLANFFSFLTFESQGHDIQITIAQTAAVLFDRSFYLLGSLVLTFIIVFPLGYLVIMLGLLTLKGSEWGHSTQIKIARFAAHILPWAMAEVFIVGVLVALIKLFALADIDFGIGFWSYLVFTILFVHISSIIDRQRVWRWVDLVKKTS